MVWDMDFLHEPLAQATGPRLCGAKRGLAAALAVVSLWGCASVASEGSSPAPAQEAGIVQWVRFELKPEQVTEFRAAALDSLYKSRREPGNLEMRLYADPEDPSVLFVYSRWKDAKAMDDHGQEPHTLSLRDVVKRSVSKPPEVRKIEELE